MSKRVMTAMTALRSYGSEAMKAILRRDLGRKMGGLINANDKRLGVGWTDGLTA